MSHNSNIFFYYTRDEFITYCQSKIEQLLVAINRKARGSTVEDDYFIEHCEKLLDFFLSSKIKN